MAHCKERQVTVSYCGVNAHHQNGLAERTIGILRDEARVALWHAVFRWPSMLLLNLWPYAVRNAADIRNSLPTDSSGLSPLERYSTSSVGANFNNFHPLFCPVYQLNSTLASGKKIRHWEPRSQLGINLGRSPRHARNVNLILNPSTGLVSPQFHVFLMMISLKAYVSTKIKNLNCHFGRNCLGLRKTPVLLGPSI